MIALCFSKISQTRALCTAEISLSLWPAVSSRGSSADVHWVVPGSSAVGGMMTGYGTGEEGRAVLIHVPYINTCSDMDNHDDLESVDIEE